MTDDDYQVIPLPADYDDSEPGSIAEMFAAPVARDGGIGDVLLAPKTTPRGPDAAPSNPAPETR